MTTTTAKRYTNHFRTRYFTQVQDALRGGYEVVLHLGGRGRAARKIVAMHRVADRVFYFDPLLNPALSYDVGELATHLPGKEPLPTCRYEGNGLHSVEAAYLHKIFMDGTAFAMVPQSYRFAV